jgi:RHS repeat-associated protein
LTEYGWDHRNRLTSVTFKTSGGTVTKAVQYEYDAYNRLVTKKLDADGNGTIDATYHWIYDGNQPVLQFDGDTGADLSHRYLWGPAVDQLLADETVDDGGAEDVLWPFTDWQGSVRHLATYNASTDTTTVANEKFYDAYGNVTSESNSAVDTLFGYTGRMFDDDTALQNNLNRWYDSVVGVWLSTDPDGFAAGDPNLYRYVGNSPGDLVDPDGLQEFNPLQGGPYPGWGANPAIPTLPPPDFRPAIAYPTSPSAEDVKNSSGEWHSINVTVVNTRYFNVPDAAIRKALRSVSKFYHRYGLLINWEIVKANKRHSNLCELDLEEMKRPMQQKDVQWYYREFEDKPTVFLIDDIDIVETCSPGAELAGYTAYSFAFVPDRSIKLGVEYDLVIAHELGHILDLDHVIDPAERIRNLMRDGASGSLQRKELQNWQLADHIRKHPSVKPISDPASAVEK